MSTPLWTPPSDAWEHTRLGRFAQRHAPNTVGDYEALWAWSVSDPEAFWPAVWAELDIDARSAPTEVVSNDPMPSTRWFSGATLNYAEHMLRPNGRHDDDVAVISVSQSRADRQLTVGQLREQVRCAASTLRSLGVRRGDRVAGYIPNIDEALVAFLASAAIGAVWSSCAPEFGERAVLDRWTQVEPTVLITVNGYRYGSRDVDLTDTVEALRSGLPSVRAVISLRYLESADEIPESIDWDTFIGPTDDDLEFVPVPFDHPLYILYSSGTTGLPKAIVHGHGGILLEHGKQLGLQMDLGPGDRFFWFSTTGWMMWNFLVSGLMVGASVVLFDGNPAHPTIDRLWSLVAQTSTTFAGFGAPYLTGCADEDLSPGREHDLSALRGLGSTGAPLPATGFRWAAASVSPVPLASISGGTDVCSAFLGGAPVVPVEAGRIPCRQLGWSVEAFGPDGTSVRGVEGELVITKPAPSMPVGFWGDDDRSRYSETYFQEYPGVWRHGDWITIDLDGSCVVSGRSDATLNRGGVRLGTTDFYSVVESDPAVEDSLVVHLDDEVGGLGRLILFVVVSEGHEADAGLENRLDSRLRAELSPRHGPDEIVEVPVIPRTISGKKLEVPVKRILQGVPADRAASAGSLADEHSLDPYIAYARRLRSTDAALDIGDSHSRKGTIT